MAHGRPVRPRPRLGHQLGADDRPPPRRRPVRSEQATADRTRRAAVTEVAFDEVVEEATARFEQQQVRRCLGNLTELQREAVDLAYYHGYSYREVAELLGAALPTVKTRMRDALIRLRDCLGVSFG